MSQFAGNYPTINEAQPPNCHDNHAMEDKHQSPPSYETVSPNYSTNAAYPAYSQPLPVVQALPMEFRPLPYDNSNYNKVVNDIMPPPSFGNTSNTTVVITNQPRTQCVIMPAPYDYTTAAWLVCLCCCWPLGLAAIIFANSSRNHLNCGNVVEAHNASQKARMFIIASIVGGCVLVGIGVGMNVYIRSLYRI